MPTPHLSRARRAKKIHVTDCEQDLKEAFRAFDEHDNGCMDVSSFREIVSNLARGNVTGKFTDAEVDDIVRLADPDGKGHITFDVFRGVMMRPT